jgi:hypothetical protein
MKMLRRNLVTLGVCAFAAAALLPAPESRGAVIAQYTVPQNETGETGPGFAATTHDVYFGFTVTPGIEASMDLTSLTFNTSRGGGSTPRGFVVRSSADNFASNLASLDVPTQRPTFTPVTVELSGPQFQNVFGPLTFRIYAYSPASGSTIEFDDITLNGTVTVIPEPGFLCVAGLGAMTLLARRRRV